MVIYTFPCYSLSLPHPFLPTLHQVCSLYVWVFTVCVYVVSCSCLTVLTIWTIALCHGIFQTRILEWVSISFSRVYIQFGHKFWCLGLVYFIPHPQPTSSNSLTPAKRPMQLNSDTTYQERASDSTSWGRKTKVSCSWSLPNSTTLVPYCLWSSRKTP